MDFSEGAARATVAVCDWTCGFCLGFVIASTWYPYAGVPVVSAHERCEIQCAVCLAFAGLFVDYTVHQLDVQDRCIQQKTRFVGSRGKNSLAHQHTQSAMSAGGIPATAAPVTTMAAPTTTYGGYCQLPEPAVCTKEWNRNQEMVLL